MTSTYLCLATAAAAPDAAASASAGLRASASPCSRSWLRRCGPRLPSPACAKSRCAAVTDACGAAPLLEADTSGSAGPAAVLGLASSGLPTACECLPEASARGTVLPAVGSLELAARVTADAASRPPSLCAAADLACAASGVQAGDGDALQSSSAWLRELAPTVREDAGFELAHPMRSGGSGSEGGRHS